MLSNGTILLGRYMIGKILGQGGTGTVYLAFDKSLGGKRLAIKQMPVDIADEQQRERAIRRFQSSAQVLAGLDHPYVVKVTHYFEADGTQYLVMGYVDGETLETVARNAPGPLPWERIRPWAMQLCDVLDYLHSQQPPIIFRDLKPSNVMLAGEYLKLIDFALSRMLGHHGSSSTFTRGSDSDGYAAAELYGTLMPDLRADVYSLGATLYRLLTREVPPISLALTMGVERLPRPSSLNRSVSPELEAVLLKMMAASRDQRYGSIAEAREALKQIPS